MEILDKPPPRDHTWSNNLNDTVDLHQVLAKFWARKHLILSSIVFCTALAFVIAKLVTPLYSGSALVIVKPQPAGGSAGEATSAAPVPISPEMVQSEVFVLQSR